jgi:hypothetical protein
VRIKAAIAILAIGLLVCVLLWLRPPAPVRGLPFTIGFIGFTNSAGTDLGLFGITNPPDSAVELYSVTLKVTSETNRQWGNFVEGRRETWGLVYTISVDSTNQPLQVVWQFQRRAKGPRRLIEWLRELWAQVRGREIELFTGSKFFATNETRVLVSPKPTSTSDSPDPASTTNAGPRTGSTNPSAWNRNWGFAEFNVMLSGAALFLFGRERC